MNQQHRFFTTAPKGMEALLADELRALGAANVSEARAGAGFQGDIGSALRVCLWSRVANRVLLPLARFPAADPDALYDGVQSVDWAEHMAPDGTLAVDFSSVRSQISHTQFGAQKVKDAIVDQFRIATGERPSVAREQPDLRINVYLHRDTAVLNLDLSGDSLHRRGYRAEGVAAPLKENLAAAILLRSGWAEIAKQGRALVDPVCGSGTLPIEAALVAADIAPGLQREHWGFLGWLKHEPEAWAALLADARRRREAGLARCPPICGFDISGRAVAMAQRNAELAGLAEQIEFAQVSLADCPRPGEDVRPGLLVANPPYGERLGEMQELRALYRGLGDCLLKHYTGWRAAVITSDRELGKAIGLRARRLHKLYNGALECQLLRFEVDPKWVMRRGPVPINPGIAQSPGAQMFANRLRKNLKQLTRWRRQEDIHAFRAYDADMPEYALAVDVYDAEDGRHVHVQEYAAPAKIPEEKVRTRRHEALSVLPEVLAVVPEHVHLKLREKQRGSSQYEKLQDEKRFHIVREGVCRLWVNFADYLDTGLFLDHRITRRMIGELAAGRTFLNLFAYTGAATVHAALGGATSTTTVDMSKTYLDWARRNLVQNDIRGHAHQLVQADVTEWLAAQAALLEKGEVGEVGEGARGVWGKARQRNAHGGVLALAQRYGLIFLDPPTFSNSKRMADSFDVQRDHVILIRHAVTLLEAGGVLIFSNNFRRFKLDEAALSDLAIEDISRQTLPQDFARKPKIHRCWRIAAK
ncbi:MAG TPA: bifunctional 23S rRNA (guanine(2069)-N(7))-methyltransferase RlmK/23S rRNA (guanine(2445)-N(2))-methyltransferase RlmL [Gammaproteobacteria bacterium]|nr:bifunctional 23S rRNA (guanine(2069)-N(7))-methyltransferase RlmK/23S rRNA (guanine(2445)-N(2))-methyltransferase RlmL [Gammaproteobacteria bacterium]